MPLLMVHLLGVVAQEQLTPCQTCCSPGGDCSKASHGSPGVCCGQVNGVGRGYCCPPTAKCGKCQNEYRCYTGIRPPPDMCALSGGRVGGTSSLRGGGGGEGFNASSDSVNTVVGLLAVFFIFFAMHTCARGRTPQAVHATPGVLAVPMGKPIPPGAHGNLPVAVAHAAPMQHPGCHPVGGPGYGYGGGGYGGGGNVAMGAGMGFLGGMMMGEMMADAGHHGGGDYGGGDYGGGGDFGGGGGDFAADM